MYSILKFCMLSVESTLWTIFKEVHNLCTIMRVQWCSQYVRLHVAHLQITDSFCYNMTCMHRPCSRNTHNSTGMVHKVQVHIGNCCTMLSYLVPMYRVHCTPNQCVSITQYACIHAACIHNACIHDAWSPDLTDIFSNWAKYRISSPRADDPCMF